MLMIKLIQYLKQSLLKHLEIQHHPYLIKRGAAHHGFNFPVVAVQSFAFTFVAPEIVRGTEMPFDLYGKHSLNGVDLGNVFNRLAEKSSGQLLKPLRIIADIKLLLSFTALAHQAFAGEDFFHFNSHLLG